MKWYNTGMSLLVHACCGPCAMYPLKDLLDLQKSPDILWFNPNIHPQFEWDRRLQNLEKAADHYGLKLIKEGECREDYWKDCAEEYLARFGSRCLMCYDVRMDLTARYAADNGYDAFTTTLLVSPYQQHDKIAQTAEEKGKKYGVAFEYHDWRPHFREGQNMAREAGLYRQKYCGCIFSLESSEFRDKIYKSFGE